MKLYKNKETGELVVAECLVINKSNGVDGLDMVLYSTVTITRDDHPVNRYSSKLVKDEIEFLMEFELVSELSNELEGIEFPGRY